MLMHPIDEEILINKWQPIGEDWETNSNGSFWCILEGYMINFMMVHQ